jgi:hypothetical protein
MLELYEEWLKVVFSMSKCPAIKTYIFLLPELISLFLFPMKGSLLIDGVNTIQRETRFSGVLKCVISPIYDAISARRNLFQSCSPEF